jgi:hypothetical protein
MVEPAIRQPKSKKAGFRLFALVLQVARMPMAQRKNMTGRNRKTIRRQVIYGRVDSPGPDEGVHQCHLDGFVYIASLNSISSILNIPSLGFGPVIFHLTQNGTRSSSKMVLLVQHAR